MGKRELSFTVEVEPHGQGRPRATVVAGHPNVYEAKQDKEYKKLILDLVRQSQPLRCAAKKISDSESPLHVTTVFHMPTPQYREVKVREAKKQDAFFLVDKKPDIDNLEKAVLDAVEGFLWENDGRVASKYSLKTYVQKESSPRIEVHVRRMSFWIKYKFLRQIVLLFSQAVQTIARDGNGNPLDGELSEEELKTRREASRPPGSSENSSEVSSQGEKKTK